MATHSYTVMVSDEDTPCTCKYTITYTTTATAGDFTFSVSKVTATFKPGSVTKKWTMPYDTFAYSVGGAALSHTIAQTSFTASGTKTIYNGTASKKVNKAHSAGSVTLTNNWERNKKLCDVPAKTSYKVTFNANGGSGAPAQQTKWYGESLTLSSTKPTRTGYTFQKWNTNSGGTGTNYNPGGSYTGNAALTLYAQWKINTWTVSYNANGGTGAPGNQTKTYGQTLTLSSTKPTRTGYTFQGWATSSGGAVAYSAGGSYTANAGATLYAVWKLITYSVSFNANGGTGAPANQTKEYGKTLTLSTTKPTRTGYTFQTWNTVQGGTGTNYAPGANYTGNAALSLYAQWAINTWTISYNANGGIGAPGNQTKTYGQTLTLSSVIPTKLGYEFKGWSTTALGTVQYSAGGSYTDNAGATLYAVWEQTYFAPTVNKLTATRTIKRDDSYIEDSEGTYAHVKFTWSNGTFEGEPVVPSAAYIGIREQGTSNSYIETEIPLTSDTITAYIDNPQVEQPKAYDIRVRFTVDDWPNVIKTTYIAKAYFIIDINADGTAISFGAEAPDDPPYYLLSKWSMMVDRKSGDYFSDDNAFYRARSNRAGYDVSCAFGVGDGGENHGIWSYAEDRWLINFNKSHLVNVGNSMFLQDTRMGYHLQDQTGFYYPIGYDNGTNLWIGAKATNSQHHRGETYISSGYNGTAGNKSIRVSVPNATNTGASNYDVLHVGYTPTYLNTIANIITANSTNATVTTAAVSTWGKMAQLYVYWQNKNDISVPANGNITDIEVGTLKDAYKPYMACGAWSNGNGAGAAWYNIQSNGVITMGACEGTGTARTIAKGSSFNLFATFILW